MLRLRHQRVDREVPPVRVFFGGSLADDRVPGIVTVGLLAQFNKVEIEPHDLSLALQSRGSCTNAILTL